MAGFLTWLHADVRYGYTLSFEPEFAPESPGITLLYAVLRQSLSEDRSFDFLTGEQAFKVRFATDRRMLFRLSATR
jgi:CelD/BcsL family acetyltransferase involved in cellulose biosynthesis